MTAHILQFPSSRIVRGKKAKSEMTKFFREARKLHPTDSARAWDIAEIAESLNKAWHECREIEAAAAGQENSP